jgi:hypothetical protein
VRSGGSASGRPWRGKKLDHGEEVGPEWIRVAAGTVAVVVAGKDERGSAGGQMRASVDFLFSSERSDDRFQLSILR